MRAYSEFGESNKVHFAMSDPVNETLLAFNAKKYSLIKKHVISSSEPDDNEYTLEALESENPLYVITA